ncbi:putative HNHc nuclease [Petroclostridium sp. X23]|uniref:putative HNHc nuclease n=1 Tax=Petroclostridium sp. X23 TaxID=3045146 RepID=UPI0024ADC336|nr:putative HNHc nuclease [Petroclostridium sp. X23]WHH59154.1 putative HNHc nuclease [Petroclostridium sp. X23]
MYYPVKVLAVKETDKATYLQIEMEPGLKNKILQYSVGNGIAGEIRIEDGRHRTGLQNKFIHALIRDIAEWHCEDPEIEKRFFFYWWCGLNEKDYVSTTQLSMEDANGFIDFLLEFVIEHGIHAGHPILEELVAIKDISRYLWLCLHFKKCCICGRSGHVHHVDKIQMGNDRRRVDDSRKRKICLCEDHHLMYRESIHNIGDKAFFEKHKVYGIIFNE